MGWLATLAVALAALLLFGDKLAAVFGLFAACARFSFPLGLIGLVGIGVSLMFALVPLNYTD